MDSTYVLLYNFTSFTNSHTHTNLPIRSNLGCQGHFDTITGKARIEPATPRLPDSRFNHFNHWGVVLPHTVYGCKPQTWGVNAHTEFAIAVDFRNDSGPLLPLWFSCVVKSVWFIKVKAEWLWATSKGFLFQHKNCQSNSRKHTCVVIPNISRLIPPFKNLLGYTAYPTL